ncbi:MAG: glycosyltransferase [Candidatus Binatia bacterium]
MRKLVVTTPCTRPENLVEIHRSIFGCTGAAHFDIAWHIVFDAAALAEIAVAVLERFADDPNVWLTFNRGAPEDQCPQHAHINSVLRSLHGQDFWHYVVDDDNILHPALLTRISQALEQTPSARGFIFSQWVGGMDFSGVDVREATPENVALSKIDQAQYLLHSRLIGSRRYPTDYLGDGRFIVDLYHAAANVFVFLPEVLCYYNKLRGTPPGAALPRILVVGTADLPLRSIAHAAWESEQLTVRCVNADTNVREEIAGFDPDAIVTFDATAERFPVLYSLPFDLRRRWIDVGGNAAPDAIGERAYNCAMGYILNRNADPDYAEPLVSIYTPLHETGQRLWRTFHSVAAQTYANWEWVLVDDSRSAGVTLRTAERMAAGDPRVKVHRFRTASGGIVGEAKYRAAGLCRGDYLLELDHDDELTPWAVALLVEGFRQFPDAGFAYSDCALVDDRLTPLHYGPDFAFGYGSYYDETYRGKVLKVIRQPALNPKTVRHIVGVPNHFRAWRRGVYHTIGGYNRRLSVADDYELILRTFLTTRMVHVPRCGYLQYMARAGAVPNTQRSAAGDIQRRVRSISWYYNDRIRARFAELGLTDWAADECPHNPLEARSRFGTAEQSASLNMRLPASHDG